MTWMLRNREKVLPNDLRHHLGGYLFLGSLLIFFLSSIILYGLYAYSRRGDPQTEAPLPGTFLISTVCLIMISGLVHAASRTIRRDRYRTTSVFLLTSAIAAIGFVGMQTQAMHTMLNGPALSEGMGKGVAGMLVVLAFLHALHVAGGIIALAIVSFHSLHGRYDHERHWPVDFAAQYWHFLDIIWIFMLVVFWFTTGGFEF
jgi:cytochrome c oxidase subunit 3